MESSLREKEKLEEAVSHRNEEMLNSFMKDILPMRAIHGRILGGHRGESSAKELCLSCEGCVFYFPVDFLDPGMMDKLGKDIRAKAAEAREGAARKLLSAADACDHKGLYDRPMEWAESYVAGQTQELQALSYEERGSIYPDSGLSL